MAPSTDIAVTVVGGYLGAGKTTLVNHLLRAADERVAVLVNDFGELDIDAQLLDQGDDSTITLPNGCICCSLVDGLAGALDDLLFVEPRPERLVIEASGVADPAGIAAYCHRPGYRLDLVLVLVDASAIERQIDDDYVGDTVRGQLAAADLLVINKIDLGDADAARAAVRPFAPTAASVAVDRATIDPRVLIGLEHQAQPVASTAHEVPFETWSYADDQPRELADLERLGHRLPAGVVRAKATARTGAGERAVLQHAAGRVEASTDDGPVPTGFELAVIGLPGSLTTEELAAIAGAR